MYGFSALICSGIFWTKRISNTAPSIDLEIIQRITKRLLTLFTNIQRRFTTILWTKAISELEDNS
jgi:hypothetical protein